MRLDILLTLRSHVTSCFITRYKAFHHSPLVLLKGVVFNQFLDYLFTCWYSYRWGLPLTFWSLLCFANIYEHVLQSLWNSFLYYDAIWLVWLIAILHSTITLFDLLAHVGELLEMSLVNAAWRILVLKSDTSAWKITCKHYLLLAILRSSLRAHTPTSDVMTWDQLRSSSFQDLAWEFKHPQVTWRLERHKGSWTMTSHWLFLGSSLGTRTPMSDLKTWRPLGVVTSHWLFSMYSLGTWTATSDMKT